MQLTAEDFRNGQVLLIDKPLEWTSFDVVNFIRTFLKKIYGFKKLKVGHAGTLDPLATGLLIICTGKKTKEIDNYQGMDKVYVGSMVLGATTPSCDMETEVDQSFETDHLSDALLHEATIFFQGEIEQVPPAFSAIKVKGERAFNLARKNEVVKLKSRKINIHKFDLLNIEMPDVNFIVKCSKGTYIRSLIHDFGKKVNSGAYLSALRRTKIGEYSVNNALTVEEFKENILSGFSKEK